MYARLRSPRIPTLRVSTKEWAPGKLARSTPRLMASHENCLACQSTPPEIRTATQDIRGLRRLRRKKQLKVKDLFGLSITDSCYGPICAICVIGGLFLTSWLVKPISVFGRVNKSLDHLRSSKVAAKLVKFPKPEVIS